MTRLARSSALLVVGLLFCVVRWEIAEAWNNYGYRGGSANSADGNQTNPQLPEMAAPEGVRLSLAGQPNAITVTWATRIPLVAPPYIEYGRTSNKLNRNDMGNTTEWEYGNVTRYTHTVTLTKLRYNKTYYYQVGSMEQGWSHIFNFRTFPKGNRFPLTICVFGDLGYYNGTSTPYLQKAAQRRDFDIVIHVGDIAYDLHTDGGARGDEFLRQIEPIAAYVPYMVIAGNHEDDDRNFTNYVNRFRMPNSPLADNQFYSVDVGPVHLLGVSTEYYGFFYKYGIAAIYTQYEWLQEEIKRVNKNRKSVPWVLAYQHRPFYCSNANSYECQAFENQLIQHGYEELPGLEETLAEVVDVGFWGHEHSYERLWPVVDRRVYNLSTNPYHNAPAPVYLVTGSAGCYAGHAWFPESPLAMQPASVKRLNDYGYTMVRVKNATHIHIEQISVEKKGAVVDAFWVSKDVGHWPGKRHTERAPHTPLPRFECGDTSPASHAPTSLWDSNTMYSCGKLERETFRQMVDAVPP